MVPADQCGTASPLNGSDLMNTAFVVVLRTLAPPELFVVNGLQIMLQPRELPIAIPATKTSVSTISVFCFFLTLAWTLFCLRIWTRFRFAKRWAWDDFTMLLAVCFLTVYCACVIDISDRISNSHGQNVELNNILASVTLLNVGEDFYILAVLMLKISLAILFYRLASTPAQRIVIYSAVTISSVFSVAMLFFAIFQCGIYTTPWVFITRELTHKCVHGVVTLGMTYTHGAVTCLTDWTFVVLPIFILKDSLLGRSEKLTIIGILMFGSVGGIASFIRFKYLGGLGTPRPDFLATSNHIAIWSCVEPAIGISAGCAITLRPLLRFCLDKQRRMKNADIEKTITQNIQRKFSSMGFRQWGLRAADFSGDNIKIHDALNDNAIKVASPTSVYGEKFLIELDIEKGPKESFSTDSIGSGHFGRASFSPINSQQHSQEPRTVPRSDKMDMRRDREAGPPVPPKAFLPKRQTKAEKRQSGLPLSLFGTTHLSLNYL